MTLQTLNIYHRFWYGKESILKYPRFDHLVSWECNSKENLNQLFKIEGNNHFKDLLIKILFSRAVLSQDLRILDNLNKGPVFLLWKNIILREFFCNKWGLLKKPNELEWNWENNIYKYIKEYPSSIKITNKERKAFIRHKSFSNYEKQPAVRQLTQPQSPYCTPCITLETEPNSPVPQPYSDDETDTNISTTDTGDTKQYVEDLDS